MITPDLTRLHVKNMLCQYTYKRNPSGFSVLSHVAVHQNLSHRALPHALNNARQTFPLAFPQEYLPDTTVRLHTEGPLVVMETRV